MDKTASNGLNAAAAYDLACRYNNLFNQYNPAAVAACAAAYGNMFNKNGTGSSSPKLAPPTATLNGNSASFNTLPTNTNSVSSPSNSSVSSSNGNNSSSSDSSINGHNAPVLPTSPEKTEKEEEKEDEEATIKNNKTIENSFDSVTDEINDSIKSDEMIEEETEATNPLAEQLKDLNDEKSLEKKSLHSRSSSISSLDSATSSISSFKEEPKIFENNDDFEENDDDDLQEEDSSFNTKNQIETEMISTAKEAITSCFNTKLEPSTTEKKSSPEIVDTNQTSLGSILDSLTARCSPTPSQSSPKPIQTAKLFKKVDDLKTKLSITEMDTFREELISSVNTAIQQTFKKFFEIEKNEVEKPIELINHKKTIPPPPSHNFSMSNLLETTKKSPSIRVGDLNKRKLAATLPSQGPNYKPYSPHPEKIAKYSAQSLLNMPDPKPSRQSLMLNTHHSSSTPSLSSSSSTSSTSNPKHSMVNQFYSAALSQLQHNPHIQHKNAQNFTMNSLVNNTNPSTSPFPHQPYSNAPSSHPQPMSSLFNHHQQQQHQFILAAAAAANHNQSSTNQNPNYFNMAAAANRLFTPYLLEHQQTHSNQPLISTPNPSKTLNRGSFQPSSFSSGGNPGLFHVPGKRRRTKVTDTRLSPRNNSSSVRSNSSIHSGLNIHGKSLEEYNKLKSHQSPSHSLNENDDQENYNQDYEDNHKYMEQNHDESEGQHRTAGSSNHTMSNIHNEEDSQSSFNDNGGQLATMPNGCFSSNLFLSQNQTESPGSGQNDNGMDMGMSSSSNEYVGYQTATLSSLHLRKAKLMFFFSRYPSSTILRNYFPDVKFNKANTAQLVKWFSNFREFFYIQMEKYARQHLAEGVQRADELHVDIDSEIFRALNSHYNRNNQLDIPASFCYVIEATLKEFFKSIQESKDMDPSWKKAIYKVIARMDDTIPEFFKSIKWMETLESSI